MVVEGRTRREMKKKLRVLTLSCCPWFSYNIATAPCCRRLCCSALRICWRGFLFHLVLPQTLQRPPFLFSPLSLLSGSGQRQPRPHVWRNGEATACRVCSCRVCGLIPQFSSAAPGLFPTTNTTPGSAVKDPVTSARQMSTLLPASVLLPQWMSNREDDDDAAAAADLNHVIHASYKKGLPYDTVILTQQYCSPQRWLLQERCRCCYVEQNCSLQYLSISSLLICYILHKFIYIIQFIYY